MKSSILKIIKASNEEHKPEIVESEVAPTTKTSKQKKAVDTAKTGSGSTTKTKAVAAKKKSPEQVVVDETTPIEENQSQELSEVTQQNNESKKILLPIPDRTPEEQQTIRNTYQFPKLLPALCDRTPEEQQAFRNAHKPKKILAPIPDRTPEEQQAIRDANQERFPISFINRFLDLADANQTIEGELVVKRIEAPDGIVANNINKDSSQFITPAVIESTIPLLHEYLLSNPSIVAPTWNVLIDNDLSVRAKAKKLQEIGWDTEIIMINGRAENSIFPRIYLLARILERGIV